MKVKLICIGNRMPKWVDEGTEEFAKRIRSELGFSLVEIPLAKRSKATSVDQCLTKEADNILSNLSADDFVVAFDVQGKSKSTEQLAAHIQRLRQDGQNLALIIGGPDGLHDSVLKRANASWALSAMVMPHGLVRVLVTEQLYRAHSLIQGHPYHRP